MRSHPPDGTRRSVRRGLAGALALTLAACGGDGTDRRDSAAAPVAALGDAAPTAAPSAAASADADADAGCRRSGLWQACSVVESVKRAGYAPELLRDGVRQPGLAIPGTAYRVGSSAELQLFVYADSAAARREAGSVRADDAEPAETRGILRAPAVIRSNNLVALLFDNNDRLRERVQLAIAAGLPPG